MDRRKTNGEKKSSDLSVKLCARVIFYYYKRSKIIYYLGVRITCRVIREQCTPKQSRTSIKMNRSRHGKRIYKRVNRRAHKVPMRTGYRIWIKERDRQRRAAHKSTIFARISRGIGRKTGEITYSYIIKCIFCS